MNWQEHDDHDRGPPMTGHELNDDDASRPLGLSDDDGAAALGPHPVVRSAWAALTADGVRWALLRGTADGADGDIDVLVDPRDAAKLGRALGRAGFARLAAIGHGGHRFFRTYDEASDTWLTLDVVTELAFGPGGWLLLGSMAEVILERRVEAGSVTRLAPDDAFWVLLLHDLLDRPDSPPAHLRALSTLVRQAGPDGSLGRRIDELGGAGSAARLAGSIRTGDMTSAQAVGRRLARRWARTTAGDALRRRAVHEVTKRLRKPHTALRRRGIDVAVLGPDGSGKSTLAASLATGLLVPTRTIYLGLYGAKLAGVRRFGGPRRLTSLWRGWTVGLWHRLRGRVVVYDRHGLDALVGLPRASLKARLRRWILRHAIPDPALVLVLDAPAEVMFARKGEHDVATLDLQRRGYLALAARMPSAEVLDASRDPDAVRRDAIARTWRRIAGVDGRD